MIPPRRPHAVILARAGCRRHCVQWSRCAALCLRCAHAYLFVKFFSDAFLFADAADERFLVACESTASSERRWPVLAFNAGMVATNGLDAELRALEASSQQRTVVLAGAEGEGGQAEGRARAEASTRA